MQIICFEDSLVEQLYPITLARPAYAITCASVKLIDWLRRIDGELSVSVRHHLADIQSLDAGLQPPPDPPSAGGTPVDGGVLLVNSRLVPRVATLDSLQSLASSEKSVVIRDGESGSVLAAKIIEADCDRLPVESQGENRPPPTRSGESITTRWLDLCGELPDANESLPSFGWPHEVVAWHMEEMSAAMNWRIEQGGYTETENGVFVQSGVSIGEYPSVDTSEGPILLDRDVNVGPFCFLSGPVYAGPGTRVIEHAALKDGVALGHTVKIGGEVEASVIEPYTNKQHHGFLGHSYLGSWINLGAGTCNSDLKNTYGKINIQYGDKKVSTGMQFLGCIIGDYSKTAINTSIFTGKVIGVCSMLYGFATSNVPSYVNYARLFGQTAPLPAEVMVNTQLRMFSRRKVQQRPCDIQLIHDMFDLTVKDREAIDQYGM